MTLETTLQTSGISTITHPIKEFSLGLLCGSIGMYAIPTAKRLDENYGPVKGDFIEDGITIGMWTSAVANSIAPYFFNFIPEDYTVEGSLAVCMATFVASLSLTNGISLLYEQFIHNNHESLPKEHSEPMGKLYILDDYR